MGWTKREYIAQAFVEIGLAGYIFDVTDDELNTALRQLNSMVASWNGRGVRLGWPMPSSPEDDDLDTPTEAGDSADEAIFYGLAVRIGPSFGKTVSGETKFFAKQGYDLLLSLASQPLQKQLPHTMPAGAGNKPWRTSDSPFIRPPRNPLLAGPDSKLEFD